MRSNLSRSGVQHSASQKGTHAIEAAAASASILCLVHCLALPLLLLLPGILGLWFLSESFHIAAFAFIVPSALAAFMLGYRRHHALTPALCGMAGIILLAGALVPGISEIAETGLTVVGSLLLLAGHGLNWRKRTGETL